MEILTKQEQNAYNILLQKSDTVVSRDEIAQAIWGELWLKKYSDWRIDRLIYLLRKKLPEGETVKTIRNSGYSLLKGTLNVEPDPPTKIEGTLPTQSYLEYMNNPANSRQVYKTLFNALGKISKAKNILAINSYSYDNVDSLAKIYPNSQVIFTNFDVRAIEIHAKRIRELKLNNFYSNFDDIRNSNLKNEAFDLVINDFRLNFNTKNSQNISVVNNVYRLLKKGGVALFSVVVDPRYESAKFGADQELAPTNKDKPWVFSAQENLVRKCFTVPYYKKLFTDIGFSKIEEFDTANGKKWTPPFRRFKLTK